MHKHGYNVSQPNSYQLGNLLIKPFSKLSKTQFGELVSNYDYLSQVQQKNIRDKIKKTVVEKEKQFEKKIKSFLLKSKDKICGINLIVGATGSGKSTLFNYINGVPLIVQEEKNSKGTAHLIRDEKFVSKNSQKIYSQIGNGFVSITTQPIFTKGDSKDYINVDLPGQFDNKDFIQSIINASLRIRICELAPKIKLTIVVSFNQFNNRAAAFKKTVEEIQKFIGNWEKFDPRAVFLMITQVPNQLKDLHILMNDKLKQIAELEAHDLNTFRGILKTIIQRQAFGVMPTPNHKIIKKLKGSNKSNPNQQDCYQIELIVPVGQIYSPKKTVCSPELINEKIESINYMNIHEGLLCPGIKSQSMKIVNYVCYSLIQQLKKKHLEKMIYNIKRMNKNKLEQNRIIIRKISDFSSLSKVYSINKFFQQSSFKDLNYFLKLANIKDLNQQLLVIKKDLEEFISKMINEIDEKQLKKQIQRKKRMEREQKRLNNLKKLRYRLIQTEESIKNFTSKSKSHKQEMKELKKEWFQIKEDISDQQDDQQKQERMKLENFNQLRIQPHDENKDLKKKLKNAFKQKSKWENYLENKYSNDAIYNLVLQRRLRKIDQALQKIKQIKQEKKLDLQRCEESIQEALDQIAEWREDKKATKNIDQKDQYSELIATKKQQKNDLQNEWFQIKDQISDLQDDNQKRMRQTKYQQFDEDLSEETDYQILQKHQLENKLEKIQHKHQKLRIIKDVKKDYKGRFQFLKIVRRMRKLMEQIKQFKQFLNYIDHPEQQEQNDDD